MLYDRSEEKKFNMEDWQFTGIVNLWTMLDIYAAKFIMLLKLLEVLSDEVWLNPNIPEDARQKRIREIQDQMVETIQVLEIFEMPVSVLQCKKITRILDLAWPRPEEPVILDLLSDFPRVSAMLREIIIDELSSKQFYFVRSDLAKFYFENQFSKSSIQKFPCAIYDMEEAGKCFALGRHTACASHLMRVMEVGLKEIVSTYNLVPNKQDWGEYIRVIKAYCEMNREVKTELFAVADRMDSVRIVWRNSTMHVERQYSEEEALEVFNAAKNLMTVICETLD